MGKHKHKDSEKCFTCEAGVKKLWYRVRLYLTSLTLAYIFNVFL